jgi:hypothetical protein
LLALLVALILPIALVLSLAWVLALLVGVMPAALLSAWLVLVVLVLLSALVRIISHYFVSFRKLPGEYQRSGNRPIPTKPLKINPISVP